MNSQAAAFPPTDPHNTPTTHVDEAFFQILESAMEKIKDGKLINAIRQLDAPLSELWAKARASEIAEGIRYQSRKHNLFSVLQRDPFTNRAATKPRGYAGDAVMMDYIYKGTAPHIADEFDKALFNCITHASTALSVCFRRQLLRSLIDDTVSSTPHARLLSVASGHARELDGSLVGSPVFDGEFVALDQDQLSCEEVARSQVGNRVRTLNMGVIDLLKGGAESLGSFDLIYSAGLYDYLSDVLARRLTKRLLHMLRPGGRLLIGNFVPDTTARAYMEIFMDWNLIFRSEADMQELARHAGATQLRSFLDPHRNVVYVEITKEKAEASIN
jgi:extracellular factor (EF) 3-hydroxypalmitic acid methyl ester biosynthesis protein